MTKTLFLKSFNHLTLGTWEHSVFVLKTNEIYCSFFSRHQLLSDDDLGPLYDLLIDEPPMIRRAIGELVYDHLIAQNIKTSHPGARGILFCKLSVPK